MQLFLLSLLATAVAGQYLSVGDLLDDNAKVERTWMEIGYAQLNDVSWTEIETTSDAINANDAKTVAVFLSLPDYGGPTFMDGWPMVPKMQGRAVKTSRGTYKFSAILVQPNDSYCPKLWWTPTPSGDISVGWMAVEEGVYNVSDTMFVIDSSEITRDNSVFIANDTPFLYHAKSVHNYTSGCDSQDIDAPCTYVEKPNTDVPTKPWLHLGAIQQLQTSVNKGPDGPDQELYLSVRARHVFTDRIVLMLMTHSVWQAHNKVIVHNGENFTFPDYPTYETLTTPEIVGYFVWEKDLRLKCVEGLVMETNVRYRAINSNALEMPYYFKYSIVPALFGMLGTINSVADSTVLRVFNRTLTSASFITQEDQCTDEELQHTTTESGFAMIIGDSPDYFAGQPQETQCFIVYDKQPCVYDILLIDSFGDGWGNNYFEVVVAGEITRYDVPCGSTSIQISTTSCEFSAQMKCDGACTTTWENYWEFPFRGVDHYGDHDSTLHVKDHAVTVTDPVNIDPNARVNACDQCKIAPPAGTAAKDAAARAAAAKAAAAAAVAAADPTVALLAANVVVSDPAASPAASVGVGSITAYVVGTGVFFNFAASGTSSPITGVSFAFGAAGVNSDPPVFSVASIPVSDVAPYAVQFDGSFVATEDTIALLLAGGVYCAVYTAAFPLGELRGQVVAAQVGSSFMLSPDNEVPAVTSSASGQADLYHVMDGDNLAAVLYSLNFVALDSAVTAVHFQAGAAGATGAIIVGLDNDFSTGYTQFTGIISDDTALAAITANKDATYLNVHTITVPTGELRAQIAFVVEDAAEDADANSAAEAKAKPKPIVPVVIELFEEAMSVNGWYDASGMMDTFSEAGEVRRLDTVVVPTTYPVPRVLTYPKYTIANEFNTKLIASGSICPVAGARAAFERCEEKLPANGNFIFRATGWVPGDNKDSWKFCGVTGMVGQELQFEMQKGKCVPGLVIDAGDLCAAGGSIFSIVAQVEFEGVVLSEMSHYETLVFENEIAEMMGSVVSVSMNSYTQTAAGLLVTFGVNVAAERYNVDATVVQNIAPLVSTLQSSLNRKLVNNLFMTSASKIETAGYPRSALLDATHANLVSFNYIGVKYLSPLPADMVVSYPKYNADSTSPSYTEATQSTSTSSSFPLATVASVFGVAVVVAFVAMKAREARPVVQFKALPTESMHGNVDLAEDTLSAFDLGMESRQEAL